jgi:hypothetical protein
MLLNFLSLRTQADVNEIILIENILRNARYAIWMKNIWFTDSALNRVVLEKMKQGLSVHIILSEDFIEEYSDYLHFDEFIYAGGELFVLPSKINRNIKNSRFILLDNEQMLYHSYNSAAFSNFGERKSVTATNLCLKAYTDYFLKLERYSQNIYRL